tara:strand:+ start:214 stop:768 length:555 start_codon:yes stop_codon:yes gene_type:complete
LAKAVRTGKVKKFNRDMAKPSAANISFEEGVCAIDSNVDIMGIQIHFKGKAEFTPQLPEGWILQGNNNKMIMFALSGVPIQKQILFTYNGEFDIRDLIISDKNATKITCKIIRNKVDWDTQGEGFASEYIYWDDMKIKKSEDKIKKTIYNLPDYNLPEVDKKQIKKQRRTRAATTTSSGSIGGY